MEFFLMAELSVSKMLKGLHRHQNFEHTNIGIKKQNQ